LDRAVLRADPDSQFITLNGARIHYKQGGQGQPALLLLHGFAASEFSWCEVMQPLSRTVSLCGYTITAVFKPSAGIVVGNRQ